MIHVQLKSIKKNSHTPILTYCRKLIAEGHDPLETLHVYRDEQLALIVHEIGIGARLTVDERGTPKFIKYKKPMFK